MTKNPCYKCKNRIAACHDTCELYIAWQAARPKPKSAIIFEYKHAQYIADLHKASRKKKR